MTQRKPLVVLGMLGTTLDTGKGPKRWERWRPTVALCQHAELLIHRLELLFDRRFTGLFEAVAADLADVSPETAVRPHIVEQGDPWELEEVYSSLFEFARSYRFRPDKEDYLVHITTGTHIAQICMFLLTEARYLPARLIQTSPPRRAAGGGPGSYQVIDLDLSKYDRIAQRFRQEQREGLSFLKSGIDTRNAAFNQMIEQIERVAVASPDPMLLLGPTGAGKSQLARRIHELKRARRQLSGEFIAVNCATLRGDAAMSALFGHIKGAASARRGYLKQADGGVLFLDEIGELGPDEQAMLLSAIEDKRFYPVGADTMASSDFQLIAGTNRDLAAQVAAGRFRHDLLARINLWTYELPGLAARSEDIEPNLDYELEQCRRDLNLHVTMSREARNHFLDFATSSDATWKGNFRDLNAAVRRMATLCAGGRIALADVRAEIDRLRQTWRGPQATSSRGSRVERVLGTRAQTLDRFDRVQLEEVLRVCAKSRSLSAAGCELFAISRSAKKTPNDADRLRKYLARFDLCWADVRADA
jgi:transcriptional regulatory protein RtcR